MTDTRNELEQPSYDDDPCTKIVPLPADEKTKWAKLSKTASNAIEFWAAFLDLLQGTNNDEALTANEKARLLLLLRAMSWVESRHGTGSGMSTAAKDPMQCGSDAWWSELSGPPGAGSFLKRGPSFGGGIYAGDLANKAAKDAAFPSEAKLSVLSNPQDGAKDAKFNPIMSFYWAVPLLVHRMNRAAGQQTFQCGDLSPTRLLDGAARYNAGGFDAYRLCVEKVVRELGGFALRQLLEQPAGSIVGSLDQLMRSVVETLRSASEDGSTGRFFFPNGISLIEVDVSIGDVHAQLKVAGKE
jgi:hypothetical protein